MRWAIMVELTSAADDPAAASAEARARLDAAGLTDATIHAVRRVYDHPGPLSWLEMHLTALRDTLIRVVQATQDGHRPYRPLAVPRLRR